MDLLDTILLKETENLDQTRSLLGESNVLHTKMTALYSSLGQSFGAFPGELTIPEVVATWCVAGCQYHFTMALLQLLRGHPAEVFPVLRKSVELCAYSARVKRHPHFAEIWLKAKSGQDSYGLFLEKFKPGKLFPDEQAELGEACATFDFCSKFVHPSIYYLASHVKVTADVTGHRVDLHYFGMGRRDALEMVASYFYLLDNNFRLIKVFEDVMARVVAKNKASWESQRGAFESLLGVHRKTWSDKLGPLRVGEAWSA